jgi:hypothetical protein
MAGATKYRCLDAGGPFILEEHDPPDPCAHGVAVETRLDGSANELTLLLRETHRHADGETHALGDRIAVPLALTTGDCSARHPEADQFLKARPWLAAALLRRLPYLRDRAQRMAAQRDRTSCLEALEAADPTALIAYDRLFPADWDLLFHRGADSLWAVDLHCPNPDCTCTDIVVEIHEVRGADAKHIADIRIDLQTKPPRRTASPRAAPKLFGPLWSAYADELIRRHHEVRTAVRELAARGRVAQPVAQAGTRSAIIAGSRNAPCPCGSGMKYKHCCARHETTAEPSVAAALRPAR